MTELDQALAALRQSPEDRKSQSRYYDLFLNTVFHVPTLDEEGLSQLPDAPEGEVLPLVIEAQGNDYLMLFETRERLTDWAQAEVRSVEVPGHVLAATSMPPLHWALNVGTEHSKEFHPEEIAWLREAVEQCRAKAEEGDS